MYRDNSLQNKIYVLT